MAEKSPRAAALFAELKAEEAKLLPGLTADRELLNSIVDTGTGAEVRAVRERIKAASAKIAPIQNELAALARLSGSKGIKIEPGEYAGEMKE